MSKEHGNQFGSHVPPLPNSPRLVVNRANAILNHLYAVVESESRLALVALGLDPGIGVLHNALRSRDSLTAGVMEASDLSRCATADLAYIGTASARVVFRTA